MITTGFRELILNQDSRVTVAGTTPNITVAIDNLGTFTETGTTGLLIPSQLAALGVYDVTDPFDSAILAAGEEATFRFYLSLPGRVLGELFPEHDPNSLIYTVYGDGVKTGFVLLQEAVIAGFNDKILAFTAGGALDFVTSMKPGYEGVAIDHVTYTKWSTDGTQVGQETEIVIAETTAPSAGVNTGKMLEQSVVLSTPENNPYGMNEYGHDQIDLRGTYAAYMLETTVNADGWESHEAMGHQDVNQALNYKSTKYMIYLNEATISVGVIAGFDAIIA